jgi:hypothetical protein
MLSAAALAAALLAPAGGAAQSTAAPAAPTAPATTADDAGRVVARVNGAPVTRGAVLQAAAGLRAQGRGEDEAALGKEALRRAILLELLYQRAVATGVAVEPSAIDEAAQRVRGGRGGAARELPDDQLRAWVERNLVLERFLAREVQGKVAVTEPQLRELYERKREALRVRERVAVTDVLFFLDTKDPASRAAAERVLARIGAEAGGDPSRLEPDGSFIVRTLELKEADDPELYAAAKRLAPGALSGVVTAGASFHIVRLDAYDAARERSFDEVRPLLERELRGRAEAERLRALEQELRAAAAIELVAPAGGAP